MPADLHHHWLMYYRFIANNRILPLILNDHGEQLTNDGRTVNQHDIDVMSTVFATDWGIGRLFEPIPVLQPDREQFIP